MSVVVEADGARRQLDNKSAPPVSVTAEDAGDPEKLARMLEQVMRDNAELRRRFAPRFVEFRGIGTDGSGTTKIRLFHGFGGPVRYWPTEAVNFGSGGPSLETHPDTDVNTLVLVAYGVGTVTIRVEESG